MFASAFARTFKALSSSVATTVNHHHHHHHRVLSPNSLMMRCCSFSSSGRHYLRAYPRFSIYSPNCVLNMSIIPPPFSITQNNVVTLDYSKKGRIMLEWVPRNAEGTFRLENIVRFALSPDEIGLAVDQLPDNELEFSRVTTGGGGGEDLLSVAEALPDKVVHMIPVEGGGVSFKLDFEMDGVGGQTYDRDNGESITGPLEVTGHRGEVVVMLELMRTSIPALTGWSTMLGISMQNALNSSGGGGGGGRSGSGGGGGEFGVPF